ncbi:MAG: translin family protein [Thermoplasmata archaeon]|nr:translin family protein [Thermoplasmata archaeon]
MQDLGEIALDIESQLNEKEEVREVALKSSRNIIRLCGMAIRSMHMGNDPVPGMEDAMEELHKLVGITRDFPDLLHSGIVESAMQEYVEVRALHAYINSQPLPPYKELGVTPEAYILGIGDLIGEIRRLALDNIRKGAVDGAAEHLDNMEKLYDFLMNFNYPNSMVGVRRKQDIARGVLEKTRGDVTNAIRSYSLEKMLNKSQKE